VRRSGNSEWRTFVEEFGTQSPSKFSGVTLRNGDQVRIAMPGGGGYGDPLERDRALVERDLREGFVTAGLAARDYGWEPLDG
jgi:N-methylhydantoinase B